ncbi:MAG TPA: DUF1003 domain-containing protein, partial [Polyangiaceae bacterium]
HIAQKVASIADLHSRALATVGRHQRGIEWLTAKLGRPSSLYVILACVAAWIVANVALGLLGRRPFDPPPFFWLQGAVATSALLMTTMVLTCQNRQGKQIEQRAQLDLQVNLASEAKIAKLIALVEELRRDLPSVPNRVDSLAEEMQETVDPDKVLSALEKTIEERLDPKGRGG